MNDISSRNEENQEIASEADVRVLLFGVLREELGATEVTLRLPVPVTGAQLMKRLAAEHPAIAQWQSALLLAVDQQYASPETRISGSEEVALIPPVSGG